MKDKRSLWISLLATIAIAVIGLAATLSAGLAPKLGLDLAGGLSVVYETHTPVTSADLERASRRIERSHRGQPRDDHVS